MLTLVAKTYLLGSSGAAAGVTAAAGVDSACRYGQGKADDRRTLLLPWHPTRFSCGRASRCNTQRSSCAPWERTERQREPLARYWSVEGTSRRWHLEIKVGTRDWRSLITMTGQSSPVLVLRSRGDTCEEERYRCRADCVTHLLSAFEKKGTG